MSKTIGIIGLGSIGMRHAKNLRELGHHVWGLDPDMKKRLELGYDYTANHLDEMENADGFVIASPTEAHYQTIIDAYMVAPGAKLFVEKPIAHKLVPLHQMHNVVMVGNNLRFHSVVKKVKDWMPQLGTVQWASFTCAQYNDRPQYRRDGVTLNWGAHEVDLALYLLGPEFEVVSSWADERDTTAIFILRHTETKAQVFFHFDYTTRPERRGFTIVADNKYIETDLVDRKALFFDGTFMNVYMGGDNFDDNYKDEMQAFIQRIDFSETLGATAEDGLRTLEILLKAKEMAS